MLGRKRVESEQDASVLGETGGRGRELRSKRRHEEVECLLGRLLRLRHPDVVEHGFRLGLHGIVKLTSFRGTMSPYRVFRDWLAAHILGLSQLVMR